MSKVVIIGGGAAGMAAAIGAAECGHDVSVYEKNEKLGKKIYITGKGRCNLTNGCDTEDLFRHMVSNGKFLYSAIYGFTNFDIVDLVEANGCPVKEERGARMFPVSDHASDVTGALERKMRSLGVKIFLNEPVKDIVIREEKAAGIILEKSGKTVEADAVVIATGGLSYPSTGSTGDGYRFAKEAGHTVTPLSPALVPFGLYARTLTLEPDFTGTALDGELHFKGRIALWYPLWTAARLFISKDFRRLLRFLRKRDSGTKKA